MKALKTNYKMEFAKHLCFGNGGTPGGSEMS